MPDEKPEFDEDDSPDAELAALIREKIAAAATADDEEEAGGFDAPLIEEKASPTVSQEEGHEMASKARFRDADGKFQKALDDGAEDPDKPKADADPAAKADLSAKPGDKPAATSAPEEGAKPEGDGEAEKKPVNLAEAAVADLLKDIEPERAAEIGRRISASVEVLDLFKGKEEALKMHGLDRPHDAIKRLLYLNEFAQAKPDEYLAWVAQQVNPKEAHTVMASAAKRFGYKLVKEEEDGDEFEDEETKRLRRENAELKAGRQGEWGPDAPQNVQHRAVVETLQGFVTEKDETGQLKRPYYEILKPRIVEMAKEHVATTKKLVTTEDLQRFYASAEEEARGLIAPKPTSAAQPAPAVQDQPRTEAAKPAGKPEKAASKMLDGDGPGATRRPALPEGADLMTTLKHYAGENG